MKKINWAIMGVGDISHKFAKSFKGIEDAQLYAAASRDKSKADEFAKVYGITKAYGSYEEMLKDDQVDLVYVATPNSLHKKHTLACIENGKGVLCEKAFSVNKVEALVMASKAREKGTFLMEAMWTRFLPAVKAIEKYIEEGHLGDIRFIKVNMGYNRPQDPSSRRYNNELGGGALLDIGVYAMSFITMVKKVSPIEIKSFGNLTATNVDGDCLSIMKYEDGSMAEMLLSITTHLRRYIEIIGTKGTLLLPSVNDPRSAALITKNNQNEVIEKDYDQPFYTGFEYQIMEANQCFMNGKIESDRMPLKETIKIISILDKIREDIGIVFPNDKI
ncbi:MAG: Gfo/Idh/MocA family oxidoreductase [Clostridia bacterium]|nr:Gfo/Idh/MocA family oxidoreductase [Clostridia bacterium]